MGKGKYQIILAKDELTYDDVLVLNKTGKIKSVMSPLLVIKYAGDIYLKIMSLSALEYITRDLNKNTK